MATLQEIESKVTDGIRAVTSATLVEVARLRHAYPTAFDDGDHEILVRVERARDEIEADLMRLRARLNAALARGSFVDY